MAAHQRAAVHARARTLGHDVLIRMARQRFGQDASRWAFQCPSCGHVATADDFPKDKRSRLSVECARRYSKELGCAQVAYLPPEPGPWTVLLQDGSRLFCFALAPGPGDDAGSDDGQEADS